MRYPWIDEFLLKKPGVTKDLQKDWNWLRYQIGGKLFAAVCLGENDVPFYITLKLEPEEGAFLRQQYEDIVPGFYMNKMHWNSIKPDGAVPDELLKDLLDKSYQLVLGGFSKKKQKEILEAAASSEVAGSGNEASRADGNCAGETAHKAGDEDHGGETAHKAGDEDHGGETAHKAGDEDHGGETAHKAGDEDHGGETAHKAGDGNCDGETAREAGNAGSEITSRTLSCCGTDCRECGCYGTMCKGCNESAGKVFHAPEGQACPIYECSMNQKKRAGCGGCRNLPCDIWRNTKDPSMSEEEFENNIRQRVGRLRGVGKEET